MKGGDIWSYILTYSATTYMHVQILKTNFLFLSVLQAT